MGEYFTIKYLQSKRYHSHLRLHEIGEKAANSRDMRFSWSSKPFWHDIHLNKKVIGRQREFECCSYWKCKSFDWCIRSIPVCSLVESNSIYSRTIKQGIQVGTSFGWSAMSQNLFSFIEEHRENNSRAIALINELGKTQDFPVSIHYEWWRCKKDDYKIIEDPYQESKSEWSECSE